MNVKEYLYKYDGGWCFHKENEPRPFDVELIEIPEGAEIAIEFNNPTEDHGVCFYKYGGKKVWSVEKPCWEDSLWCMSELLDENYDDEDVLADLSHKILWQRPSQPEELPFIDDGAVTIEDILQERQNSYGDFTQVANTTGQLMGVILNSANGKTLTYAHEEALHMICSKIARIVNGDMNHLDSWVDIGGYARLIENLIKENENEK